MAQFRFGITNMSKWRLNSRHGNHNKKVQAYDSTQTPLRLVK